MSNVRGFSDKIERGDRFLGGNAELRWNLWNHKIFYWQLAAFVDYGTVWGRGKTASEALSEPYWSIGIGSRGAIKSFLGRIGRADLVFAPQTREVAIILAVSQFF